SILVPEEHRQPERFPEAKKQRLHAGDRHEEHGVLAETSHDQPKVRKGPDVRHDRWTRTIRAFFDSLEWSGGARVWQNRRVMNHPGLGLRLAPHIADARAAWPGICVSDEAFVAFVAERLPEPDDDAAVSELSYVDLYLACACARRDPAALDAFE